MQKLEIIVPDNITKATVIYSVYGEGGYRTQNIEMMCRFVWEEWKKVAIKELGLNAVTERVLLRNGIEFVGHLFDEGERMRRIRGLGLKKEEEIKEAVSRITGKKFPTTRIPLCE